MIATVSEHQIFRATKGLSISTSQARTLSHCLFWAQHATHWDGDVPVIWKTGPELEEQLRIVARTANRHFKQLAKMGYWSISYRPRPGTVGKVTWLKLSDRSLQLLALAQELLATKGKKAPKATAACSLEQHPSDTHCDEGSAQTVTSKQTDQSGKTAEKQQSFILPSKAGKKEMQEAQSASSAGNGGSKVPKAPGYAKATPSDLELADIVRSVWNAAGVKEWDWSSIFTWQHVAEIRKKLAIRAIDQDDQIRAFLNAMFANWSWIRHCMTYRYANHPSNLHAPSPMALNHEFEVIRKIVAEELAPKVEPTKSNFDDDL